MYSNTKNLLWRDPGILHWELMLFSLLNFVKTKRETISNIWQTRPHLISDQNSVKYLTPKNFTSGSQDWWYTLTRSRSLVDRLVFCTFTYWLKVSGLRPQGTVDSPDLWEPSEDTQCKSESDPKSIVKPIKFFHSILWSLIILTPVEKF